VGWKCLLATALVGLALAATTAEAFILPADPQLVDGQGGDLKWLSRPGEIDLAALNDTLGDPHGWAVVECVIGKHGNPGNCVVVSEHPPGRNVARMAIKAIELFRAASKDSLGAPSAGRRVRYVLGSGGASMIDNQKP
jgi:hypothetical protein